MSLLEAGSKEETAANAWGVSLDHETNFPSKRNCIVKELKSHQIGPRRPVLDRESPFATTTFTPGRGAVGRANPRAVEVLMKLWVLPVSTNASSGVPSINTRSFIISPVDTPVFAPVATRPRLITVKTEALGFAFFLLGRRQSANRRGFRTRFQHSLWSGIGDSNQIATCWGWQQAWGLPKCPFLHQKDSSVKIPGIINGLGQGAGLTAFHINPKQLV
nr:hypothetical protein Iba_scaffold26339CG0010 [Ipomoea batatas]